MTWYALGVFFTDKDDLEYLDFLTDKDRFSMAQLEWRGLVLNGPKTMGTPIVDLSDQEIGPLLKEIFGSLNFGEIAELYNKSQVYPQTKDWNWGSILENFGFQNSQRNFNLLLRVSQLPSEFLFWIRSRKSSPADLMPLLGLKKLDLYTDLWREIPKQNVSRNEGRMILDLLVDLILMGKSQDLLQPRSHWLNELQKMRSPMTLEKDCKIDSSSWPRYVQIRQSRQGDKVLGQLQITYTDATDLNQKLQRLSQWEPNQ